MVYNSVLEMVGNTPILKASRYSKKVGLTDSLYVKLEFLNPTGSVKDRIAKNMLLKAMEEGKIHSNTVIIEPTSGNTGIGLASMAGTLGLKTIIVMPETMSIERQNLIKGYGAEVILTEGSKGMQGAIDKAEELAKTFPDVFVPNQFFNRNNPSAHYQTTGPEIWKDMEGKIDICIAGVGTGGTISGVGKYLKERNPDIEIIAVEPSSSPILSKGYSGKHDIQGIGAGFIPETLDTSCYDAVIPVSDNDAIATARLFMKSEGISVGISSGAALYAAMVKALEPNNIHKKIVVILPDSGDRYLSTALFK